MNLFGIHQYLAATDALAEDSRLAAVALLVALATLTLTFSVVRATFMGNLQDPVSWGLRFLLVVACLAAYRPIVDGLVKCSQEMTGYFVDQAGWDTFVRNVGTKLTPMLEDPDVDRVAAGAEGVDRPPEPGLMDRMFGVLRGGAITFITASAYYLQFVAFDCIAKASIVFLSILRIIGPFMIALGVFSQGASMKQWFNAIIQVLLWPVMPPMFMMITRQTALGTGIADNVCFVLSQAVVLTILTIATPFAVKFFIGRGAGVASAAAGAFGAARSVAMSVGLGPARHLAQKMGFSGDAVAARSSGRGNASSGAEAGSNRPADLVNPSVTQRADQASDLAASARPVGPRGGRRWAIREKAGAMPVQIHHSAQGHPMTLASTTQS